MPVLLAALLTLGCSGAGPDGNASSEGQPGSNGSTLPVPTDGDTEGRRIVVDGELWVDPRSPAALQIAEWRAEGRDEDAEMLRTLAEQPLAEWPPGEGGDPGPRIREVARAAGAQERTAVFVAYNVPHRDCGQYSRGGAGDGEAYRSWIGSFADNIGDAEAIVILEPDAVPHIVDGCTAPIHHEERYTALSEAVDRLGALPRTRVYIDAGNPTWIADPADLVEPLRRAGIDRADGFALNVSNYRPTEEVVAYGRELSELLGGARFVVDTSRNGNGPLEGDPAEAWCNPPGRALGTPPTTETGDPLIDAHLWIKRPGESDGECRGGPPAGEWWPEYALELVSAGRR
ncbi:glycoside hydrolase family 6 protein [Streptomyces sp. ST2-7A]|uniref:glycoside hydrolase family 6 protein n=1 Tax=Streptomyces sp. ST2-7A TaxID=2907214 RepID=UPI001F1E1EBD|nr:glycoside hydrolase family 6 protein [Streptomyces sp. ST2-7A]MCE7080944.1 glycoside hydrolase family 6 protein [Streptomyces sp. ST2-7A]